MFLWKIKNCSLIHELSNGYLMANKIKKKFCFKQVRRDSNTINLSPSNLQLLQSVSHIVYGFLSVSFHLHLFEMFVTFTNLGKITRAAKMYRNDIQNRSIVILYAIGILKFNKYLTTLQRVIHRGLNKKLRIAPWLQKFVT